MAAVTRTYDAAIPLRGSMLLIVTGMPQPDVIRSNETIWRRSDSRCERRKLTVVAAEMATAWMRRARGS